MSASDEMNGEIAVVDVQLKGFPHVVPWYFDTLRAFVIALLTLPACTEVESFSVRYCKRSEIHDGPNDHDELLNWLYGESASPDGERSKAITRLL